MSISELLAKSSRSLESHVVAESAFFSTFGRIFVSLDNLKESPNIVFSLDIGYSFDLTYFFERIKSLIIFSFRLNIGIIPETEKIVFFLEIHNWHGCIWTTAYMKEEFWLLLDLFANRCIALTMEF